MALAANVIALVRRSSPGPTPAANAAACSAAVPEENATAYGAPHACATCSSKAATLGPCVSQSPRKASATAATSSSSIVCLP